MEQLFEEFEGLRFPSLLEEGFFPFTREFEQVAWVPQLEVLTKNEEFIVRADLPGIKRDEIKVELANDLLTISGERKEEKEEKQEGFYRSERTYSMSIVRYGCLKVQRSTQQRQNSTTVCFR